MTMSTRRDLRRLAAAILLAWALGGCAFTFGEGPPSGDRPAEERWKDSRRLYREELERIERRKKFTDPIPSER